MAWLLWMSSRCGTRFLGTETSQLNEMSEVLYSPSPLFHLLSKHWCHWFQGTKFLTQALDRENHFFLLEIILNALNAFLYWVGAQALYTERLILGWPCPTLFRSGLIYVCQATAGLGICWWAGEAWPLSLSLCIWQALLPAGRGKCLVRDGSVWEEQRELHPEMRDWEWATTTEIKRCAKNRGNWNSYCQWKEPGGVPSRCLFSFLLLSFIYKLHCLYTQLFL